MAGSCVKSSSFKPSCHKSALRSKAGHFNSQSFLFFIFKIFIFTLFCFTILYWFCHTLTWIHHRCIRAPNPESPSHLSPHIISLDHPHAPAPSILYPVSNTDWRFVIIWQYTCFNAILPNHPTLSLSLKLFKRLLHWTYKFVAIAKHFPIGKNYLWSSPLSWEPGCGYSLPVTDIYISAYKLTLKYMFQGQYQFEVILGPLSLWLEFTVPPSLPIPQKQNV